MDAFAFSTAQKIILLIIPLIFAITVHEAAHGYVANMFGDPTAKMMGRLTLNPIKHIDPVGTLLIPGALILAMFMVGNRFIFGWAKPVPVTWQNLRNPRRDMALVALAGPGVNFLMAIAWGAIAKFGIMILDDQQMLGLSLAYMGLMGILINLVLMVLNLIPIPPLDGSRVVASLLPPKTAYHYNRIEPYGFFILIALLVTNILPMIIAPPMMFLYHLITVVFGLRV
ncbi:MAG: site-2 protease family protein [Legionellales bacterium]|nr:site-2 protease family protein [Legionellales bacterium]|tara:strand:- start:1948 stop:2628 length:681 start_codon:yes stop_codon:yes gene_type:complete